MSIKIKIKFDIVLFIAMKIWETEFKRVHTSWFDEKCLK